MNSNLKAVLAFILGAGSGIGATYVILKKQYNNQMNEEVQELKEYYERLYGQQIEELNNRITLLETGGKAQKPQNAPKTPKKASKPNVSVEDKEKYEEVVKTNYNAISASKDPEKPVTAKKKSTKTYKKAESKGPEIITFEEYNADRKHEKVILTYLDQEDMVLDENNEPIVAPEDLIGDDFKDVDSSEYTDGSTVYVRNDSIGKDFEIVMDVYHTYRSFIAEESD